MHFSTTFPSLSTSWWNFKKSKDKLKQWFNEACPKPNLNSNGIKLMKLVYTPLNVSFLKTLVANFSFSRNTLTSRKDSTCLLQRKLKMSCSCEKNCACSSTSFIINWFKIFKAIFQPFTFMITKKNISQCRS